MNIIVLCGGLSSERDVSISSGTGVAKALRERGHNVVLVDLYFGYMGKYNDPCDIFSMQQDNLSYSVSVDEPDLELIKSSRNQDNESLIGDNVIELCRAADITFLALHGEEGENGKIQATFDVAGIKYTGSGYLGSALAMNKTLSKKLFVASGIPTPPGITVDKNDAEFSNVGFPCVVKPCSGGSSVGTSIVNSEDEYLDALKLSFKYEAKVIVEKYITGREFTVGIMEGIAMPVIEIIPKEGFYDYKNKYQAGLTIELCPAPIDEKTTLRVQHLAEKINDVLMIDAYCRVDFLMDNDDDEMYCLEANTLPGMTPTSLIPQMADTMGMSFGELCEKIIEASMRKYQ
jgi:D-alanine--D-alanine ligase